MSDIHTAENPIPFIVLLADWSSGVCKMAYGCYRGNTSKQTPYISDPTIKTTCDGNTLTVELQENFSYMSIFY